MAEWHPECTWGVSRVHPANATALCLRLCCLGHAVAPSAPHSPACSPAGPPNRCPFYEHATSNKHTTTSNKHTTTSNNKKHYYEHTTTAVPHRLAHTRRVTDGSTFGIIGILAVVVAFGFSTGSLHIQLPYMGHLSALWALWAPCSPCSQRWFVCSQ